MSLFSSRRFAGPRLARVQNWRQSGRVLGTLAWGILAIGTVTPAMRSEAQPVQVPRIIPPQIVLSRPAPYGGAFGWKPNARQPVTALTRDASGYLWVATEEAGVWRYDASAAASTQWKQFTAADGLGDDSAYALAVDKRGRVWAGTLNHGVSVWNGKEWRNYGVMEGPLGERVFDIATCPTDGDVWIATNAGLTRYSLEKDTWSYVTRADGLPSDQVQALAFDKDGNLIAGMQCDGIALGAAKGGYKNWKSVPGPEQMPLTATGRGLPSNLINDVMVASDSTIYAATTTGLAWSRDKGASWSYVRGVDYAAKVRGLYGGPPVDWKETPGAVLAEDYVSCLAEDGQGRIWLGHWQAGNEAVEMQSASSVGGVKTVVGREQSNTVRAILASGSVSPLFARYDEGIGQSTLFSSATGQPPRLTLQIGAGFETGTATPATAAPAAAPAPRAVVAFPALPSPVAPPSVDDLQQWVALATKSQQPLQAGQGVFLDEDWRTGGDWLGRYGRQRTILCAAQSPLDNNFGFDRSFGVEGFIGPHAASGDRLRHWIAKSWVKTDDRRALYNPVEGYRRQGEWDDHGETYSSSHAGPDVWVKCSVPTGVHRMSLYFFNENGNAGKERQRDYLVELKKGEASSPAGAEALPTQAQTRVRDFRGGVYKRFLVRGPGRFWVKVGKNNSFNTLVSGVFLDKMEGESTLYDQIPLPWMSEVRYDVPGDDVTDQSKLPPAGGQELAATTQTQTSQARRLWVATLVTKPQVGVSAFLPQARLLALRALTHPAAGDSTPRQSSDQSSADGDVLARQWRWLSTYWTDQDRAEWQGVMARAFVMASSRWDNRPPLSESQKQALMNLIKMDIAGGNKASAVSPTSIISPQ